MEADVLKERFEALRSYEFHRLDEGGHVYLDYTGSGLYGESQLRSHLELLEHHVLGNPHSANPTSSEATHIIEQTRLDVLDFFGADPDEYTVVFTHNASGALKLVGEAFPFGPGSRYVLLRDNHNSVNGIRIYAETRGAEVIHLPLDEDLRLSRDATIPQAGDGPSLFAFPAQSNFSGVQHPLALTTEAKERGYMVLLDAAAFVPTNPLDLSAVGADFACVSFYKMFGLPTGVGALLARREALARLERPWFAGGTVEYVSVQSNVHQLQVGAGAFEDGTPNFLGIAAVGNGLEFLRGVGMQRIHERVAGLTERLLRVLQSVQHPGGRPLVAVYGPLDGTARGGTVAFNLVDAEGAVIPYGVVERAASEAGISLRGGCFCNPGAAEVAFKLPESSTLSCFQSMPRGAFDLKKLADCLNHEVPVGAMRASLGIATNEADLARLEAFLADFAAGRYAVEEGAAAV